MPPVTPIDAPSLFFCEFHISLTVPTKVAKLGIVKKANGFHVFFPLSCTLEAKSLQGLALQRLRRSPMSVKRPTRALKDLINLQRRSGSTCEAMAILEPEFSKFLANDRITIFAKTLDTLWLSPTEIGFYFPCPFWSERLLTILVHRSSCHSPRGQFSKTCFNSSKQIT